MFYLNYKFENLLKNFDSFNKNLKHSDSNEALLKASLENQPEAEEDTTNLVVNVQIQEKILDFYYTEDKPKEEKKVEDSNVLEALFANNLNIF
jgi:hypothetical protein